TDDLATNLQSRLNETAVVRYAMRYQNPSIAQTMRELMELGVEDIKVALLFPQYSSAAWGSAAEEIFKTASTFWNVPSLSFLPPFYHHDAFLDAFATRARRYLSQTTYDYVLFSFHGLPQRHCIKSASKDHCFVTPTCCNQVSTA